MNRDEFFKFLIETYDDFTEKNTKARLKAYKLVLDEGINFDILHKKTLENYQSFRYAPTPAQLLNILRDNKKFDINRDFFGIEG